MRRTAAKMISSLATRFTRSSQAREPPNLMRKSSNLSPSAALRHPPPQLHHRLPLLEPNSNPDPTGLLLASELPGSSPSSLLPAIFAAGVLGLGTIELSHADAEEGSSEPLQNSGRAESFASQERQRLEELLRSRGMRRGSYPPFTLAVKGQKVTVKFKIPPTCEVAHLIVDLVSHLGLMAEQHTSGSEMLLRAWNSAAAWQLTLNPSEKIREIGTEGCSKDLDKCEGEFCVLIFESLVGTEYCEIEFIKQGSLTVKELDALVSALKLAGERGDVKRLMGKSPKGFKGDSKYSSASLEKSVSALEAMGVRVYGFDEGCEFPIDGIISWDNIAGYDQQKREIEDTILLALQSPEVYDDIAHGTRCKFEINRPRAVLFDGPPGTGKTSSARVIAKQAGVPLLYVPLEVIMSKYYGESERLLGNVFSLANDISNGAIIFLDEIDSIAVARDSEMHEVTRRILSVLLRQIDGFEQEKKVVVLAATNRKQDLDPALISRFDSIISFDLPDQQTREEIIAQYAKHLNKAELVQFASATEEMSGRDIKDVCQQAERRWASKLIRGQILKDSEGMKLPPIEEYVRSAERRREASLDTSDRSERSSFRWKPSAVA